MGRTDDIINVAGHRLSTSQIEEVVASHAQVIECAVVGGTDNLKGEIPVGFVVIRPGHTDLPTLHQELVDSTRSNIGPIASPRTIIFVEMLPKTRSGKTLRKTLRDIINGVPFEMPQTIEDPDVISAIVEAVRKQPMLWKKSASSFGQQHKNPNASPSASIIRLGEI
jgi:acyl-coenzyme A synthetase/AMP-(fatty) acid ligase